MKKKFAFVQVNFQQGPKELEAYYLPYSAGVICSYALSDPQVTSHWDLESLVWKRLDIHKVAQSLKNSNIVAFSTYVWNREYHFQLAQEIKKINPNCLIVFGGPEMPVNDNKIFINCPWIDIIVKQEGEIVFKQILLSDPTGYQNISGILINNHGTVIDTGISNRIQDLDCLPSPYLTGLFDQVVKDHPNIIWNGTLETNRGCPYACTFCDWGSLTYNKVKKFNLERVFAELEWIGQHCGYVSITDANFGMFVERDNLIIDKLIEVQRRWQRLTNYTITWAKNQKNEVVEMARKLIDQSPGAAQGLYVSVQSMDLDVLENIKRRNLEQHKIEEIFALCDSKNIPVYTELILGLPGDTAEKWRENFYKLFRSGNHTGIAFYQAQLLENAEMNLFQKRIWNLKSRPMYDYMSNSYNSDGIEESVQVVTSTRDIPHNQMLDLLTWSSYIHTMHVSGLTTFVARYLNKTQGIDYSEFYEGLYDFLYQDPWWRRELDSTRLYYQEWFENGRVAHPKIGGIEIVGWNLYNRLIITLHDQNGIDSFYSLLTSYIDATWSVPLLIELLEFQRQTIIEYKNLKNYPLSIKTNYNFYGYILHDHEIMQPCTYEYDTTEDKDMSFSLFLHGFYYGRKRNFGKTLIKIASIAE
jgi:tRNA A37 methylthiotransferase MiaB